MTSRVAAAARFSDQLRDRYARVRERIAEAARRGGRKPDEISLVAVTKAATPEQIVELIAAGHRDFGENRIQNLVERIPQVAAAMEAAGRGPLPADLRWHMIGALQRNKLKKAIEVTSMIHSLENLRQAETIHEVAMDRDQVVDVLVQVNVAGEKTKHGMNARAVPAVAEQFHTMAGLEVRGLMCIAPFVEDPERVRPVFTQAWELFEELRRSDLVGTRFDTLSMGMSGDFEVAIECGSTMVRVGSAIFGSPKV